MGDNGGSMTLERLRVVIEAYTKPYREEVEKLKAQTKSATDQVDKHTGRMAKSFGKVQSAVKKVLAVLGIGAIIAFGKSCIDLGSDLTEVQNVVDVTFGDMTNQVNAFAENAITQFGLSETVAKKYMGTYGAMAKAFGLNTQQAYDMSASITGLTGDVASFYNLSTDEAYTKLKSIFTGETESLKDLGVVMTQTALDQYAMNNGFGKTTAKMTEQEKVMLRYQFVMSQLSLAQGDFARTSDGWANQTRVLQLRFEQLKATIGQGLINSLTPVLKVVNSLIERLQVAAEVFRQFTVALFGDATGGGVGSAIASGTESAAGSTADMADNLTESAKQTKKIENALMGFDKINKLPETVAADMTTAGTASPVTGALGNSGLLGSMPEKLEEVSKAAEKAAKKVRAFLDGVKAAAQPAIDSMLRFWDALAPFRDFLATGVKDFYEHLLVPIGIWVLGEGLPRFFDVLSRIATGIDWNNLNVSLRNVWDRIAPFATNVGEGLLWFLENVLEPLAIWTIDDLLTSFLDLIGALIGALDEAIKAAKPAIKWFWDNFLVPIAEWTGGIIISVLDWLTERLEAFSQWAANNKETVEMMAEVIIDFLAGIVMYYTAKKICTMLSNMVTWFGSLGTILSSAGGQAMIANIGFVAVASGILMIAQNWNNMTGIERIASVLGVLTAAALTAAIAFGAFQSALTLGAAVAGIAIGIGGVVAAVYSAKQRADNMTQQLNNTYGSSRGSGRYIGQYASGGFPDAGEVFIARENGPEMVGKIGGRSAVANNAQIVSGVKQGVYEAVKAAQGPGTTPVINVYVGGKQITDVVVEDVNNRTRSTGVCPIMA